MLVSRFVFVLHWFRPSPLLSNAESRRWRHHGSAHLAPSRPISGEETGSVRSIDNRKRCGLWPITSLWCTATSIPILNPQFWGSIKIISHCWKRWKTREFLYLEFIRKLSHFALIFLIEFHFFPFSFSFHFQLLFSSLCQFTNILHSFCCNISPSYRFHLFPGCIESYPSKSRSGGRRNFTKFTLLFLLIFCRIFYELLEKIVRNICRSTWVFEPRF